MRRSKGNRNGSVPPNSTVSVEVEVVRVRNKKPVKVLNICISNCLSSLFRTLFTLIVQEIVHTHCSGHCSHSLQLRTPTLGWDSWRSWLRALRAFQMDVDRPTSYQMSQKYKAILLPENNSIYIKKYQKLIGLHVTQKDN